MKIHQRFEQDTETLVQVPDPSKQKRNHKSHRKGQTKMAGLSHIPELVFGQLAKKLSEQQGSGIHRAARGAGPAVGPLHFMLGFRRGIGIWRLIGHRRCTKAGHFESGWLHFRTIGYFEGRLGAQPSVDQEWYMKTYPDIAKAILDRKVTSALDHYVQFGYKEGRLPRDPGVYARWYAPRYLPAVKGDNDTAMHGAFRPRGISPARGARSATLRLRYVEGCYGFRLPSRNSTNGITWKPVRAPGTRSTPARLSALEHYLRHGIDENSYSLIRHEPTALAGSIERFLVSQSGFCLMLGWLGDEGCDQPRYRLIGSDFHHRVSAGIHVPLCPGRRRGVVQIRRL